jgi:pimeloyl-ACP methyl ester carboxylesterase
MKGGLLFAIERGARFALKRRGLESRTVPTEAGALHVYDARGRGDLPTTVVLHGLASSATVFGSVLTRLRPHVRRVVAPDLPGHGFSAAPSGRMTPERLFGAVREALDALVDEPMILVGSSLGGALALRYAVERPGRLVALALVSPLGARIGQTEWDRLRAMFKIDTTAAARQLIARLYHHTPWYAPALFAPGLREVLGRAAIRDIVDAATLDDLPTPDSLRALAMPILLLWGQSERLLPPSSLAYFRRHLPAHAVIEEPAGFGHCPHFDDPARLAARLVELARSSSSSSSSSAVTARAGLARDGGATSDAAPVADTYQLP